MNVKKQEDLIFWDTLQFRAMLLQRVCFIQHALHVSSLGWPLFVAIFMAHENGMKMATTKRNQETTRARHAGWKRPFKIPKIGVKTLKAYVQEISEKRLYVLIRMERRVTLSLKANIMLTFRQNRNTSLKISFSFGDCRTIWRKLMTCAVPDQHKIGPPVLALASEYFWFYLFCCLDGDFYANI